MRLACRAAGDEPRRVILLHGFPEAAFVWDEVLLRLAPQIGGLAPNLRGYPGSSQPTEASAYRPRHLVGDLVALIESTGGTLDLLVAHDWGGAIAWNLAAERPDLLRRLLIINSPHPAAFLRELRHNPAQQVASAYMNRLCQPDAEQLLAREGYARLLAMLGGADWLTPALSERYREAWREGLTGPLNYYRASPLRPPTGPADALHSLVLLDEDFTVRVPTTVLWGEQDRALLPGLLHGLNRWVPDLRIVRVPEASHWIVHEESARVVALIQQLLDA
ncbi:MAG: alpha/beta fold hydrolase [Rubrivivax sp.]|nr:alpha/beta fold hydrolase [Rubrivivax sp.]